MIDWQREIELDPTLRFDAPLVDTQQPRVILLTGTTGFLGANLLAELLRRTEARIVCLVRAEDAAHGRERIANQLEALALPGLDSRVEVVVGSLNEPRLGLNSATHDALAERIERIYHIGAAINFVLPYRALRGTNVDGTKAIIELATTARMKPLHHVSSLAVFFGQARTRISERDRPGVEGLRTGYAQTKWVAEQHIFTARAHGLPATIYRTGRISANRRTGATSSWNDLINRMLQASVIIGSFPELDIELRLTPVDYVCSALLTLSDDPGASNRDFHLLNSYPVPWRDLVAALAAHGYAMQPLAYDSWLLALKRSAATKSRARDERETLGRLWMALASGPALLEPNPTHETPDSGPLLTRAGLSCPPIDAEQLAASVRFLADSGYLPAPGQA